MVYKLNGRVGVHTSIAERDISVSLGEELRVDPEAVTDEQDKSYKVLANAQLKEIREDHVR